MNRLRLVLPGGNNRRGGPPWPPRARAATEGRPYDKTHLGAARRAAAHLALACLLVTLGGCCPIATSLVPGGAAVAPTAAPAAGRGPVAPTAAPAAPANAPAPAGPTTAPPAAPPPAAPPAAQITESGWSVRRWLDFDNAWASITAGNPQQVSLLANSGLKSIVFDGFVTTDVDGQALLLKDACVVYVYQATNLAPGPKTIKLDACSKNSSECTQRSMTTYQDCLQTVVQASTADFTFASIVTVVDEPKLGLTMGMVHQGTARITPTGSVLTNLIAVPGGSAAYVAARGREAEVAQRFGGRAQGQVYPIEELLAPLVASYPQLQPGLRRLNAVLISQKLTPLAEGGSFALVLQPLNRSAAADPYTASLDQVLDWGTMMDAAFPRSLAAAGPARPPLFYVKGKQSIDLLQTKYSPDAAQKILAQRASGAFAKSPVVVWYQAGIAEIRTFANVIAKYASVPIELHEVNPAAPDPAYVDAAGAPPALVLSAK